MHLRLAAVLTALCSSGLWMMASQVGARAAPKIDGALTELETLLASGSLRLNTRRSRGWPDG
ncbi:MAG: hypothetical protein U5K74_04355 [Gemmatimonadaceae bacterium]|nr:hypothetical protein [Gemmatimonadaceae bacterium]